MSTLSVAHQRRLSKSPGALSLDARILAMDELDTRFSRTRRLRGEFSLRLIADLKVASGIAIIYVSHRMDEIFRLADRVTVMRDGKYVDTQADQRT